MELSNKIAVITGAGSGIGRASSLKLASNGAKEKFFQKWADRFINIEDAIK